MKVALEELKKILQKKFSFFGKDVITMTLQQVFKDYLRYFTETTELIMNANESVVSEGSEGLKKLYLMVWAYDKEMCKIAESIIQGGKETYESEILKIGREAYNKKIMEENLDISLNDARIKFEEARRKIILLNIKLYNEHLPGIQDNVLQALTSWMNDVQWLDKSGIDVEKYKKIIDDMDKL